MNEAERRSRASPSIASRIILIAAIVFVVFLTMFSLASSPGVNQHERDAQSLPIFSLRMNPMAWPPQIVQQPPHLRRTSKMKMIDALKDTIELAESRNYGNVSTEQEGTELDHLKSMYTRIVEGDFSEAKISHWLGYCQGVLVAFDVISLEEAKEINRRHA
jgi:hypothetical protein